MSNPDTLYPPEITSKSWVRKLPFGFEVSFLDSTFELAWRKRPYPPMEWRRPDWRARFTMPWSRTTVAMEHLRADGTWRRRDYHSPNWFEMRPEADELAWVREVPISPLVNNEHQRSVMTVYVERWITRPHFFRGSNSRRFDRAGQPSLKLEFSPPVGRGVNSWKGGTCGHSAPVMNGESYESAIVRYVLSRPHDHPQPTIESITATHHRERSRER
jgi:hypothetical protein